MRKKRSEIWEGVMIAVTEITEITQQEIFSASKKADVTQARGLFFLAISRQGLKPCTIMRLCQKNGWESVVHSTITKHMKRANKKMTEDDEFIQFYSEIEDYLDAVAEG